MPFLVLDGLTVKATEFARLPDERGGGGLKRTVNGQLRGRSDWVKRGWTGVAYAADAAELTALLAKLNPDNSIAASGDALGESVTVRATVRGEIPYTRSAGAWYFVVPLSLREV